MRGGIKRIPSTTLHGREFNPREQERQIGRIHFDVVASRRGKWSLEGPSLQTFVQNQKTVSIPMHQLDAIESTIEEQKQIPAADVSLEFGLDDRV